MKSRRELCLGFVLGFTLIALLTVQVASDGYGGLDLESLIYKLPNRTALCDVLNGTCVAPGDCAVFPNYGYGGGYGHSGGYGKNGFHRFDCNLTTICCFSIHKFIHHNNGYGGHGYGDYGYGDHGHGGGGYGHSKGGYGQQKELSFKSVVHKVFNRTALCEVLEGTCVSPGDCAVFGGYGGYDTRFDCNLTTICCFSLHAFAHGGLFSFGHGGGGYGGHNGGYGGGHGGSHGGGYGGQSGGYGGRHNEYGGYRGHNGGYNNGYGGGGGYGQSNRDYDYGYGHQGGYGYRPQRRAWRLSGHHDYYNNY